MTTTSTFPPITERMLLDAIRDFVVRICRGFLTRSRGGTMDYPQRGGRAALTAGHLAPKEVASDAHQSYHPRLRSIPGEGRQERSCAIRSPRSWLMLALARLPRQGRIWTDPRSWWPGRRIVVRAPILLRALAWADSRWVRHRSPLSESMVRQPHASRSGDARCQHGAREFPNDAFGAVRSVLSWA